MEIHPSTTDPTKVAVHQVFVFTASMRLAADESLRRSASEQSHGPGTAYYVGHDGIVRATGPDLTEPVPPALIGDYWLTQPTALRDIRLPAAIRALQARDAVLDGAAPAVDQFASEVLGLWNGARWREPVSTALLGNWDAPLQDSGITPAFLDAFKAEVKEVHRQLTPLWRRKVKDERLWSLDLSFGNGLTTYDLVVGGPDPYEALAGTLPDDPRVAAVLAQLRPVERAVAMAWASTRVTCWSEAADDVITLDPVQFAGYDAHALGERVRTKLIRLGKRHTERASAAAIWKADQA
ncbi:hypothetical protein ACWIGB_15975 [Streptomyces albidoflavus]